MIKPGRLVTTPVAPLLKGCDVVGSRIIKESICSSDTIDGLSWFEEVFFYRLLVNCDDFGRMDARPKVLAARLFPLKDIRIDQISAALNELASRALVRIYEVDAKPYIQTVTWESHQQIRNKRGKYPAPDGTFGAYDWTCNHLKSNEIICSSNPIQSNTNPNTNPAPSARVREEVVMPNAFSIPSDLAHARQAAFDRVRAAAEEAGLRTSAACAIQLDELVIEYTEDWVIKALAEYVEYGGKSLAYLRKILVRYKQQGAPGHGSKPEKGQHHGGKVVAEAQYAQREYHNSDDALNAMMAEWKEGGGK